MLIFNVLYFFNNINKIKIENTFMCIFKFITKFKKKNMQRTRQKKYDEVG